MNEFYSSSVLLTYKNKLLLLSQDLVVDDLKSNIWQFIGRENSKIEYLEDSIYLEIQQLTQLKDFKLIRLPFNKITRHLLYHLRLTDKHVNSIERPEGLRLDFFKLTEIEAISLTESTRLLLAEYKKEISHLILGSK